MSDYPISYENFSTIKGKEYLVYATGICRNSVWYCICNESYTYFPWWYPFLIFDISDNRLSRYWVFGLEDNNNKKTQFFSFPEWVNDRYFYGELVENNANDLNAIIFRKYKELMDLEFPDPSISETAQIGDSEWLICPKCIDAWQSKNDRDALVKCPKCRTIFNNPRYKDEWPHLPCNPLKFKIT